MDCLIIKDKNMKCNLGKTDKIIRLIVALAGLILGFVVNPWYFLITLIGIVTAGVSFCPLYTLLGINTCHVKDKEEKATEVESEKSEAVNSDEVIETGQNSTEENISDSADKEVKTEEEEK